MRKSPHKTQDKWEEFSERVEKNLSFVGVRESIPKLKKYEELILKWGERIPLVSRGDLSRGIFSHLYDSLILLPYLDDNKVFLDVGSGAGFPGLVLAIFREKVKFKLLERSTKKAVFLKHVSRELHLSNVEIIEGDFFEVSGDCLRSHYVCLRATGNLERILKRVQQLKSEDELKIFYYSSRRVPQFDIPHKTLSYYNPYKNTYYFLVVFIV